MFDKMIMMHWIVIREVEKRIVLAYKSEYNRLDICFWLALLLIVLSVGYAGFPRIDNAKNWYV